MSKIKILIVEDNPIHQEHMYIVLRDTFCEIVSIVSNSNEVIPTLLRTQPDVVLMDIDLGEGNDGIELAKQINALKPTPIIFTTVRTDSETIHRAVSEFPVSYLIKPINQANILAAIELAIFKYKYDEKSLSQKESKIQKNSEAVFLKMRDELVKVEFGHICAIEVEKDRYLKITTRDEEFSLRSSIKEILPKLPSFFFQVHRSTVINVNLLDSINDFDSTVIVQGKSYSLGQSYKKELTKSIRVL